MSPEHVRAWVRVARDVVCYSLATTILATNLVLYVTRQEPPNLTWITAAAFFFGLVPALRIDEWIVRNGRRNGSKDDALS